jgi:hypothetical protein
MAGESEGTRNLETGNTDSSDFGTKKLELAHFIALSPFFLLSPFFSYVSKIPLPAWSMSHADDI